MPTATDEKKEDIETYDEYLDKTVDELFTIWEDLHGKDKQEERETQLRNVIDGYYDITKQYLGKVHGTDAEGKPTKHTLDKADQKKGRKQAQELLNKLALESVKKELGEDAVKIYKGNQDQLEQYIALRLGRSYDEVVNDLMKSPNLLEDETIKNYFRGLGMATVEDFRQVQRVTRHLAKPEHRDGLFNLTNKLIADVGFEHKKSAEVHEMLESSAMYLREGKQLPASYTDRAGHLQETVEAKKRKVKYDAATNPSNN